MADTSTNAVERFNVTENRNGLGFSDGIEYNAEGDYVSFRDYKALAAERDALQATVKDMREALEALVEIVEGLDPPSDRIQENYEDVALLVGRESLARAEEPPCGSST